MKKTLSTFATCFALAIVSNSAAQAQNGFDLSSLGIVMPKSGSGSMCRTAAQDVAFNTFKCPIMAEALWNGSMASLDKFPKAERVAYLKAFTEGVHAPDVAYKVGLHVQTMLDPELPLHLNYLMMSDREVIGGAMGESIDIFAKGLGGFLDKRRQATSSGTLDPIGEMTALFGGIAAHPKRIKVAQKFGAHDAIVWMVIAQENPDAAAQFYEGLRELVYKL